MTLWGAESQLGSLLGVESDEAETTKCVSQLVFLEQGHKTLAHGQKTWFLGLATAVGAARAVPAAGPLAAGYGAIACTTHATVLGPLFNYSLGKNGYLLNLGEYFLLSHIDKHGGRLQLQPTHASNTVWKLRVSRILLILGYS